MPEDLSDVCIDTRYKIQIYWHKCSKDTFLPVNINM